MSHPRRNKSSVDHIFNFRQILEKKWEYINEVCQVFIDFNKTYDSIQRRFLHDTLMKFGVPKSQIYQDMFRWNSE